LDAIELAAYAFSAAARVRILNHQNAESLLLLRRARAVAHPGAKAYLHIQALKLSRYERRMLPQFDLNLAVSEIDRQVLLGKAPSARIEVIPNGVDTEYFHVSGGDIRDHSILFVGGLTWFPNLDAVHYLLRDIWPLIRRQLPSATCKLVGRVPPGRALTHLPDGVETTGFVDDVRPFFAGASVFAVPLRVGGGTRLKILDAMASGKAIVSTSIGCEGLGLIPEKEILIGDSPEEFARQVVRVCQDAALRLALGAAGRARVEREYAWGTIGEKLDQLLKSLV
jgi:glycosyltransferase involved in cell wall biosynthesis